MARYQPPSGRGPQPKGMLPPRQLPPPDPVLRQYGLAAVVLGGQRALALLVVGHGSLWLYEHRVLGNALPPSYLALRRQVALATCMLLALTMFVSDTAGLS